VIPFFPHGKSILLLFSFIEARGTPYMVVARLTQNVKHKTAVIAHWTAIYENYAWARFTHQFQDWSKPTG
jgi:hypothetical protein